MVLYRGNYNYYDVYQKFFDSKTAVVNQTEKGLIHVQIQGFQHPVLISAQGKVQVHCDNEKEKKQLHHILESYLGTLKPLKIKLASRFTELISCFPLPLQMKFSACETNYTYKLNWWNPHAQPSLSEQVTKYLPFMLVPLLMLTMITAIFVISTAPQYTPLLLWFACTGILIAKFKIHGCLFAVFLAVVFWLSLSF